MASKKEMFEATMAVLGQYEMPAEAVEKIRSILEPKSGGKAVNLDEVTRKDENGVVVAIKDNVSGLWFPATSDFFYEDKSGKGIEGSDGSLLKRVSKAGYSIASKYKKMLAASKEAIFNDVLDGKITPEEGKSKIVDLEEAGPDFSDLEEQALDIEE